MSSLCHPQLHPNLQNFSFFYPFGALIDSNEQALKFLEEIHLIPSKEDPAPTCSKCQKEMKVEINKNTKLGWIWRCSSKATKKAKSKDCRQTTNPAEGTFFDGKNCRIEVRDVLAIICMFVLKVKVTETFLHLRNFRRYREDNELSRTTVSDYYSYCREVAQIICSNSDFCLGGEGKTVQIDETFLTKHKYHRGRMTDQMTMTILGIYCKEDKLRRFFYVDGKSKADLWPFIKKFVHANTSRICTDSAKQYTGVEQIFSEQTVHSITNHSKGEFVDSSDSTNTINDLENQNRWFKASIKSRHSNRLLHQYMALYDYRHRFLENDYKDDAGSQIMQFLLDIKKVFPGVVNGQLETGMQLREAEIPTVESEDLHDIVPQSKRQRTMTIDELIEASSETDDNDHNIDDPHFYPDDFN